jgi:hypothetical protein
MLQVSTVGHPFPPRTAVGLWSSASRQARGLGAACLSPARWLSTSSRTVYYEVLGVLNHVSTAEFDLDCVPSVPQFDTSRAPVGDPPVPRLPFLGCPRSDQSYPPVGEKRPPNTVSAPDPPDPWRSLRTFNVRMVPQLGPMAGGATHCGGTDWGTGGMADEPRVTGALEVRARVVADWGT